MHNEMPPSHIYNTIYTALQFAADKSLSHSTSHSTLNVDKLLNHFQMPHDCLAAWWLSSLDVLFTLYWLHNGKKCSERTVDHNIWSSISRQNARRSRICSGDSSTLTCLKDIIKDSSGQDDICVLEQDAVNVAMKDVLTEPPSLDTLDQNLHLIGLATKMGNKLEQLNENGEQQPFGFNTSTWLL
ncbi:hypothetical protein PR048_007243 [Dryococelus australis]|uniref:Uncharacterized protein n=1 Tax=Dryococelus australis TaxID=614101 RepID=A0ABQ9IEA8_9NEOP|nr:hypothetical protein PR048_007243 [Dryococelus australis]